MNPRAVKCQKNTVSYLSCSNKCVIVSTLLPEVQLRPADGHMDGDRTRMWGCACGYRTLHPSQHGTLDTLWQLFMFRQEAADKSVLWKHALCAQRHQGATFSKPCSKSTRAAQRTGNRGELWCLTVQFYDWTKVGGGTKSVSLLLSLQWAWFCQTGFEGVHHRLPNVIFHILFT